MDAYATQAELNSWLPAELAVSDAARAGRLLSRASDLIDDHVVASFAIDTVTGLPTDVATKATMRDACCAQVEQWFETGEEHDIAGYPRQTVMSAGKLSVSLRPSELAPRARRILRGASLLRGEST